VPPYEKIKSLLRELPDPEGARLFYERVTSEHPRVAKAFARDEGLMADALALAAWSPLLAATLAQHPDYVAWLARERAHAQVRTTEELGESLARFALTHTQLDAQVTLARFRRRELLRVYLHDIRHATTIVETTEELSNLADAALQYALKLAQQELENLYGAPQRADARGRKTNAEFTVVALGKLGSRELNYSSDIDLLFLYSDDGETTGKGERGVTTNREFFGKLAERVARIVGQQKGEGAAYRVDLRLRPHGRDGALACSLAEAARYYRETAHPWELQVLIRARASAGSPELFARFAEDAHPRVYRPDVTIARALADVRLSKQKIDRQHGETGGGFNVKLGRGGIREIEFIAQALQLAHGGRDTWLHAPHTLISLGRLADRGLINERERTELSDAYAFLRTLEHRVQMEHGLQTHVVPDDPARRALAARRMHFDGPDALARFDRALGERLTKVHAAFERVFGAGAAKALNESSAVESVFPASGVSRASSGLEKSGTGAVKESGGERSQRAVNAHRPAPKKAVAAPVNPASAMRMRHEDAEDAAALAAASVFTSRMADATRGGKGPDAEHVSRLLRVEAENSLNAKRSLLLLARIAASLDKSGAGFELSEEKIAALARLCGASEFFGEMIAANPSLIHGLTTDAETVLARDHRALMRAAVDAEKNLRAELSALRCSWSRLLVEIGARDAAGEIQPGESNRLQTSLAAASINVALLVARRELARRHGRLAAGPRLAVLGLGRLGSGGMDFGSDLDLMLVYDPQVPPPLEGMTHDEAYARLAELMVAALSNMTRDGHLYRVDLRLRPDGKNGPLTSSGVAFVSYLAERADVWEWLAHVKLRAVAGDQEYGREVEREARARVHEAAERAGAERLSAETRRVRERLERERGRRGAIDIKFGPGGMLDVYFASRFLQLRDHIPDDGEDRSTTATLTRLRAAGSLDDEDLRALGEGYALLRALDHRLRLLAGRSTRLPNVGDHPLLRDLAELSGYPSATELLRDLAARMKAVRAVYERITSANKSS
jgi:glutamate-ammonia-ligase adenylyltransferase